MSTTNFLAPTKFEFNIEQLPNTSFFFKSINIPGMTSGAAEQPSPLQKMYFEGDTVLFDEITATFNVDENMDNYLDIVNWMFGIGFPDTTDQHAEFIKQKNLVSDAALIIHTNQSNPNVIFTFKDLFPISISSLDFSVANTDESVIECTVAFRYTGLEYNKDV